MGAPLEAMETDTDSDSDSSAAISRKKQVVAAVASAVGPLLTVGTERRLATECPGRNAVGVPGHSSVSLRESGSGILSSPNWVRDGTATNPRDPRTGRPGLAEGAHQRLATVGL